MLKPPTLADMTAAALAGEPSPLSLTVSQPEPPPPPAAPPSEPPSEPPAPAQSSEGSQPSWKLPDDFEYADYVVDELRLPKEGDVSLEWFRDAYAAMMEGIGSNRFVKSFEETYKDQLISKYKELPGFAEAYQAFLKDPEATIQTFMPEYYEKLSIPTPLSEDQITGKIQEHMKQQFGENYEDLYDPRDRFKANSISRKMDAELVKIESQLRQENESIMQKRQERLAAIANSDQSATQAPQASTYDRESFLAMIEQADVSQHVAELKAVDPSVDEAGVRKWMAEIADRPMSLVDIWRIANYDALVNKAREEGYEAGRKGVAKELAMATKSIAIEKEPAPNKPSQATLSEQEFFSRGQRYPFIPHT